MLAGTAPHYSTSSRGRQRSSIGRRSAEHLTSSCLWLRGRRPLREELYRAFITRASSGDTDNTPLIEKTLVLRQEQAELLGYPNYAEVSLASKVSPRSFQGIAGSALLLSRRCCCESQSSCAACSELCTLRWREMSAVHAQS